MNSSWVICHYEYTENPISAAPGQLMWETTLMVSDDFSSQYSSPCVVPSSCPLILGLPTWLGCQRAWCRQVLVLSEESWSHMWRDLPAFLERQLGEMLSPLSSSGHLSWAIRPMWVKLSNPTGPPLTAAKWATKAENCLAVSCPDCSHEHAECPD